MNELDKAIILDRDGTINVEKNYISKIEDFEFIENVPEAIKKMNKLGYKVIIISNQSGIGRGYFSEMELRRLNDYMLNQLKNMGAIIDEIYYCPHYNKNKQTECNCRKPKLGLYKQAINNFNIDTSLSWAVGDKITDLIGPQRIGIKTALVLTGYGLEESKKSPDVTKYRNLYEFAIALEKEGKNG